MTCSSHKNCETRRFRWLKLSLKKFQMSCNQQLAKVAEDHRFAPIFVRKLPSLPQAPFPKNKLKPGRPEHKKKPEAITWLLRLPLAKERQTPGWCASNVLVIITLHDEISERDIRTICSFIGVPFSKICLIHRYTGKRYAFSLNKCGCLFSLYCIYMSRAITAQIWIWTYFVCPSFPKHASLSRKTIYQACSLRFFEYVPIRSLMPRHSWNGLSGCMEKHTHKNMSEIKTTRLRFGSNKWQTRKKWVSGIIIWNFQWDDLIVVSHFFWLSESSFAHLLVPLHQEMDFRLKGFGPSEPKVPLKDDWNVTWHAECACVFWEILWIQKLHRKDV